MSKKFIAVLALIPTLVMAAPSHCQSGEEVIFNCQTGSKIASVCAAGSKIQYRFGKAGSVELALPANPTVRAFIYEMEYHRDAGVNAVWLSTKKGPYTYEVSSGTRDGDKRYGEVNVYKNGITAAKLACDIRTVSYLNPERLDQIGIKEE